MLIVVLKRLTSCDFSRFLEGSSFAKFNAHSICNSWSSSRILSYKWIGFLNKDIKKNINFFHINYRLIFTGKSGESSLFLLSIYFYFIFFYYPYWLFIVFLPVSTSPLILSYCNIKTKLHLKQTRKKFFYFCTHIIYYKKINMKVN